MAYKIEFIAYPTRQAMADQLADEIAATLARAVLVRGSATIAVSGGSTPGGLYQSLSRRKIDWARVNALLVDERWVAPGTDGSNESFVRDALAQNEAAALNLLGLWSDAASPEAGLAAAAERIKKIGDTIDIAILGMGVDGHTASWFPHAKGLASALSDRDEWLAAVSAEESAVAGEFSERMTLTLAALKHARQIFLLIAGDEKRAAFERALKDDVVEDMPVRAIFKARPDLWACWAP